MVLTADLHMPVAAPPVVEHPYGLFSIAPPTSPADEAWELGITFPNVACGNLVRSTYDECINGGPEPGAKTFDDCPLWATGKAFTLYSGAHFAGSDSRAEAAARARAQLTAGEQTAAEARWWSGFAASSPIVLPTAALVAGLAALEDRLAAEYSGTGVILMTRGNATLLASYLTTSGGKLMTMVGTPVVAGAGFTSDRLQATGATAIRRTPIFDREGFDTSNNSALAIAERTYLIVQDCAVITQPIT